MIITREGDLSTGLRRWMAVKGGMDLGEGLAVARNAVGIFEQ